MILNHVGIGIIFDDVHEAVVDDGSASQFAGDVFAEFFPTIVVVQQLTRDGRITGGEDRKHRRVKLQKVSRWCRPIEDFGIEPGADGVQRIATGHSERHRFVIRNRRQQIDALVVCGF